MAELTPQQDLMKWFDAHGGFLDPSIVLAISEESGQHFRAVESFDTPASEERRICKCPFSLTLSHLNLISSPPAGIHACSNGSICTKLVGNIPTAAVSYFFLVEQRLKGAESFWEPYIAALPKEAKMNTPLWFQEDDLQWLLGTTIHASGTDPNKSGLELRRGMWMDQWQRGVELLEQASEDTKGFTW